jgi:hypothetical protein
VCVSGLSQQPTSELCSCRCPPGMHQTVHDATVWQRSLCTPYCRLNRWRSFNCGGPVCCRSWRPVACADEAWLPWLQCLFNYQPRPAEATRQQQQQQQTRALLTAPAVRQCPLEPGSLPTGTAMAAFGRLAAGGRVPVWPGTGSLPQQAPAWCCVEWQLRLMRCMVQQLAAAAYA